MVDEIDISFKSMKIDDRAKFFLGRRNLVRQIDKCVVMMSRDEPTEVLFVMKPRGIRVKTKAVKSNSILDKLVTKFVEGVKDAKK